MSTECTKSVGPPPCKKCGQKDGRMYGFCYDCWQYLRENMEKILTTFTDNMNAGPHDAHEENCILDEFVTDLWKFFKE